MKLFYLLVLTTCLLFSLQLHAELPIPELKSRVMDLTNTLTQEQKKHLADKLKSLESEKGSQLAILIIPTTDGESVEQFSIRVVEKWKLGRKKVNDGILILVAKNDRKMRIEVGYGLEGVLPDAICKRIISEQMRPNFKAGKFYEGIDSAVDNIRLLVNGEKLPDIGLLSPNSSVANEENYVLSMVIGFFIIIFGSAFVSGFADTPRGLSIGSGICALIATLINVRLFFLAGNSLLFLIFLAFATFVLVFFLTLLTIKIMEWYSGGGNSSYSSDSWSSNSSSSSRSSSSSSSSSSDSFSGGGGDFGGGGASGDW